MPVDCASNPYSTPSVNEEPPRPARLWSAANGQMIVHDGASLPRIDLITTDTDLIPVTRIAKGNAFARGIMLYALAVIIALIIRHYYGLSSGQFAIALFSLLLLLRRVMAALVKPSRLQFKYYTSRIYAIRQSRLYLFLFRVCSVVAACLIWWNYQAVLPAVGALLGSAVFIALIPSLMVRFFYRPWVSVPSGIAGWAVASRLSPAAIQELQQLERDGMAPDDSSPPEKIRCYGIRIHRYPLRCIVNRYWLNPFMALATLINRSNNRDLTMAVPADPDFGRLPLEEIPPFLANLASPWLSGAYGIKWELASFHRHLLVNGQRHNEILRLLSPDRQHSATFYLSTQAQGIRVFQFRNFTFATVLQDGQLVTTTSIPYPVKVPALEQHATFLRPKAAWRSHLRILGARKLHPGADPEQWMERNRSIGLLLHEAGLASGLYTPIHETGVLN